MSIEKQYFEVAETDNHNLSRGLDCNICLDIVHEPVVTFCGHLYCWPCIYKWIHFHDDQEHAHCPVCKSEVSSTTLVPLYGRGHTTKKPSKTKKPNFGLIIPKRPSRPCPDLLSPTNSPHTRLTQHVQYNSYQEPEYPYSDELLNFDVSSIASTMHPIIGMFGELVCSGVFLNCPNSYNLVGSSSSPRLRRFERRAEKSLSRICFFLFCCIFFCLLLF